MDEIMDLAAWRQSRREVKTLKASGATVVLQRVSLLDLVADGVIPQTLLGAVERVDGDSDEQRAASAFKQLPELKPHLTAVAKACIAWPPVADEPDDEHLGINELPYEDKLEIFTWATQGTAALVNFREESEQSAATGPGGSEVQPETVVDSGDN